jgi:hypothetical protein
MSHKDLLRGHDYTTQVVETDDGPRLQMKCKCGWVKLLKINSGTGTGLRVTWHVHCQEVLANRN